MSLHDIPVQIVSLSQSTDNSFIICTLMYRMKEEPDVSEAAVKPRGFWGYLGPVSI